MTFESHRGKEEANCAKAGYFISSVSAEPQYCIRRSNRAAFEGRQDGYGNDGDGDCLWIDHVVQRRPGML